MIADFFPIEAMLLNEIQNFWIFWAPPKFAIATDQPSVSTVAHLFVSVRYELGDPFPILIVCWG